MAALDHSGKQINWAKAERDVPAKLAEWKGLLQRHAPQARQILKKLLNGPIVFTPVREATIGITRSKRPSRWTG
jgi:hypothetical protein